MCHASNLDEIRLRFLLHNASLFSFHAGDRLRSAIEQPCLAVAHTFEGKTPGDVLTSDGAQALFFLNRVSLDPDPEHAAFGRVSARFSARNERRSTIEIDDTFRLSAHFTLAAMVKSTATRTMRLFSAWEPYPTRVNEPPYERAGPVGPKELILDFYASDSHSRAPGRVRLAVQGQEVAAQAPLTKDRYHHIAATYDDGDVRLYVDGQRVGGGRVPAGEVTFLANLRVGEDCGPLTNQSSGPTGDEQLIGNVDDVVVLGRTLKPADVRALNDVGAARSLAGGQK